MIWRGGTTPENGDEIARRQNEPESLRLLLVQRRAFRRGKRIRSVRLGVALTIALVGPLLTTFDWVSDDLVGSAAGVWVVAGLLLAPWERSWLDRATRAAEEFDCRVFGLQWDPANGACVAPETVADLTGDLKAGAIEEKLRDWYVIDPDVPGLYAVLLCQRSACVYSRRLHRAYLVASSIAAASAVLLLIGLFLIRDVHLGRLLIGFVLPVLPGLLAVEELIRSHRTSWIDRRLFESALDEQARAGGVAVEQLRRNQDTQFRIRQTSPPLPWLVYRLGRTRNEAAMAYSAAEFARVLREPRES